MKLGEFRDGTPCELLSRQCGIETNNWQCAWFWFGWEGCTEPLLNIRWQDLCRQFFPCKGIRQAQQMFKIRFTITVSRRNIDYYNTNLILELLLTFVLSWTTLLPNAIPKVGSNSAHICLLNSNYYVFFPYILDIIRV